MTAHPTPHRLLSDPSHFERELPGLIREIGRGRKGARDLSIEDAQRLFAALLQGRVPDLELGAILLAMRIKGEAVTELLGFLLAAEASVVGLSLPDLPVMRQSVVPAVPVVIPCYNGARKLPNLTPLLALLLARHGIPVLLHGVEHDAGRVTTAEILAELGHAPAHDADQGMAALQQHGLTFMPIASLSPQLDALLARRKRLGLRNSAHSIVKLLRPLPTPTLQLCSYTHPEYLDSLSQLMLHPAFAHRGEYFLMRGTEGETVANAVRGQHIDCFSALGRETLVDREPPQDEQPDLPDGADAARTALWIRAALDGRVAIPRPIQRQFDLCVARAQAIAGAGQASA